jgi:predicted membrane protein DUF2142
MRLPMSFRGRSRRGACSHFPRRRLFSPVAYLSSALGIIAARALDLDLLSQVHAGRLANLVAYLLLVWCVVSVLPAGRLAALVILTVPTAVDLAASFSADPVGNAVPALLIGCCLRLHLDPDCVPPRGWRVGLFLLIPLVGLVKLVCVSTSAAVLLVPASRFASPRAARLFRGGAISACITAALAWNLAYPFVPGIYWHKGADPSAAMQALIAAPWHSAMVLLQHAWDYSWLWWYQGSSSFGGGRDRIISPCRLPWPAPFRPHSWGWRWSIAAGRRRLPRPRRYWSGSRSPISCCCCWAFALLSGRRSLIASIACRVVTCCCLSLCSSWR